ETEEIIISNESFSFDEYIIARKYHLIINLFLMESRFDKLLKYFDFLNIPRWGWIQKMYDMIEYNLFMQNIFTQFEHDTKSELFDNLDDLYSFYNIPENYLRLEKGEIGDNVIYKYGGITNFINWKEICDYAYDSAYQLISERK